MDRRVVVTGMGAVTPLGCTVDTFWEGLKNGKCGIDLIQKFDTTDFKVKVGAEVKDFDPELYMSKKDVKRNDPYAVYALAAAVQAFDDSGLDMEKEDAAKVGVIVGSGIGGLMTMQEQVIRLHEKGPSRVSPLFIPMTISNMAAGNIAIRLGAVKILSLHAQQEQIALALHLGILSMAIWMLVLPAVLRRRSVRSVWLDLRT